jgi:DNA repair protein RecN (Recombination protein N)
VLRELHISGLGVIADLELELAPGLNVLTGETGAGKTMVTVGLMLALGERGSASLVRDGAPAARVQARFDAPRDAQEWAEEGEVILAGSIARAGRSTARIGGQLTTASALAGLGASLVEHHGQHQSQRLLVPAAQAAFLDRSAGDAHVVALAAYREAFERRNAVRDELDALREAARDRERELDLLGYQLREIEALDPRDGETEDLALEETRLGQVERLLEQSGSAEAILASDEGIVDVVGSLAGSLAATADLDPSAEGLAERARSLSAELAELARDVRDYREGLLIDPDRLQAVRERLGALRQLQRKYGATDAQVLTVRDEVATKLQAIEGADDRLVEL